MSVVEGSADAACKALEGLYTRRRNKWLPLFMYGSGDVSVGVDHFVKDVGAPLKPNSDAQRRRVLSLLKAAGYIVTSGLGDGRVFSWTVAGVAFVAEHPPFPPRPPRRKRKEFAVDPVIAGPAESADGLSLDGVAALPLSEVSTIGRSYFCCTAVFAVIYISVYVCVRTGFLGVEGFAAFRGSSLPLTLPGDIASNARMFGLQGVTSHPPIPNGGSGGPLLYSGDGRRRIRSVHQGEDAFVVATFMLHCAVQRGFVPVGYVCRDVSVIVSLPGCAYQRWHCDLPEDQRRGPKGYLHYSALYFLDSSELLVASPSGGRRMSFASGDFAVFGGGLRHGGGCNLGSEFTFRVHAYLVWSGLGAPLNYRSFRNAFFPLEDAEQDHLDSEAFSSEVVSVASSLSF